MTLYATWPKLVESIVVDTESYSDLEAQQAPLWYLALKMAELPSSLLYDYLAEFLLMCNSTTNMDDLLGDLVGEFEVDNNTLVKLPPGGVVPIGYLPSNLDKFFPFLNISRRSLYFVKIECVF